MWNKECWTWEHVGLSTSTAPPSILPVTQAVLETSLSALRQEGRDRSSKNLVTYGAQGNNGIPTPWNMASDHMDLDQIMLL